MIGRFIRRWRGMLAALRALPVDVQGQPHVPARGDMSLGAVTIEDIEELKGEL